MDFPDFYAEAPQVPTHDALAELLGASRDGRLDYCYADAVRLAGHSCPTVAGAFLLGRAALATLYPHGPAERGAIRVTLPAPVDHGTTGVIAQVLTLLTGAAAQNGFHGIAGRYARAGLLQFAECERGDAVTFERIDNGAAVEVELYLAAIPAEAHQRERLAAILDHRADDATRATFARHWQARVRRLLLDFADDPRVVKVNAITH